ncbi:MAG: hypothetical protein P0Y65_13740 [Candidatus Devosia phytovorans]|uniref:Uncharacterized protein n=1 Tax=Candidatus Devosia phytovorans TaxID=3121372 RepID=A0AAJ5VRF6_9HYPH|nr:hypothetical protein [Devosia sp.]WEK03254.1 MAG: hypothetical protein P0Y65_13740 [Devosia sp.]
MNAGEYFLKHRSRPAEYLAVVGQDAVSRSPKDATLERCMEELASKQIVFSGIFRVYEDGRHPVEVESILVNEMVWIIALPL